MRRFMISVYFVLCLIFLSIILESGGVRAQTPLTITQTSWPDTIFYLARLGNPDGIEEGYGEETVIVRAADDFVLYIDGEYMGERIPGSYLETFDLTLPGPTVDFAVAMYHDGFSRDGNGNGFMLGINSHDDRAHWLGTTVEQRRAETVEDSLRLFPTRWYSFAGGEQDLNDLVGGDWYKYGPEKLDDPEVTAHLQPVSHGYLPLDIMPNELSEIITGYRDGVGTEVPGGGIALRRLKGENLALGKQCEQPTLTDGDLFNGIKFEHDPALEDPRGYFVLFDKPRVIDRVVLYSGGDDPLRWPYTAVLGYAVDISEDNISWDEVGIIHDIGVRNIKWGGFDHYQVTFPSETVKSVRFRITETRDEPPNVGEMMVYGTGYAYEGAYESDWLDFDTPAGFTIDSIQWEGQIPEGTNISVQIKTAFRDHNDGLVECEWSVPYMSTDFDPDISETVSKVKYRINLSTENPLDTPVLKSISIHYTPREPSIVEGISPVSVVVHPPHPNPFNPATTIDFELDESCHVTLDIFDATGRKAATLVNEYRMAGSHAALFDGAGLASGLYFFRFRAAGFEKTGRIMLVK